MTRLLGIAALLSALLVAAPLAYADEDGAPKHDVKKDNPQTKEVEEATARAPVTEIAKTTMHSVTIGGREIAYKATAGTLTLRNDDGKPMASMFYVAYTVEGERGHRRPVTFLYNGGPGSSSLWMHMGSVGPMRVKTSAPDNTPAAPYTLVPNEYSLLDKTDLVFLDAMGTGYSRTLEGTEEKYFWGVDKDLDAFTRGIIRYVTINGRWNSPKYLFGESYGTTRSAGLARSLQEKGIDLNGVILLSSILNYGRRNPGLDQDSINYIPSYAAAAWYHDKIANKPADLPPFLAEVREWARGPYAAALAKGFNISPEEEDRIARQMSAYTGLSVEFIKECNLRVDLSRFRKELLRKEGRTIGRYDARFEGIDPDEAGDSPESDPSDTAITSAFVSTINAYIHGELGFHTDLEYRPGFDKIGQSWDWHHAVPGRRRPMNDPDVALDLAQAMRENPHLKVFSLNGYYDMATPFFGTEYDIAHMQLAPSLRGNVKFAYYYSGHMVYLNVDALRQLKADVARFYDETS